MRCPKCGFISFDHLATCLNCKKDISEISSTAQGTTYNTAAPMFLKFTQSSGPKESTFERKTVPDELEEELDLVDPDLNILINEDEEEEDREIAFHSEDLLLKDEFGGQDDSKSFNISLEKEGLEAESGKNELAVDLSQFEEVGSEEDFSDREDEKFTMNLPDELADISDLAPPPPPQKQQPAASERKALDEGMNFDMLDMDLKLDDLDLGFSLTEQDKGGKEESIGSLSLEDIDLSVSPEQFKPAPAAPKAAPAAKPGEMDMDSDLDFELDLGGLTIPKK
jgi:hypothetical protein